MKKAEKHVFCESAGDSGASTFRGDRYARLAMERLIFDELEAAIDPKAPRSFRMIEKRAAWEYRQRFF